MRGNTVAKKSETPRKSALHKGHRLRVKEKYASNGIDAFHPHEILELLLFFGIPYKDTNEIAHELINTFGDFSRVLEADVTTLKSVKNMTDNAAVLLKLVYDIARKYNTDNRYENIKLNSAENITDYLVNDFIGLNEEVVKIYLLDRNNNLIGGFVINEGDARSSDVNVGKIVKLANSRNVTRVILAHNHPDNSRISSNDVITTKRVNYHLKNVGIELMDSFVVSQGRAFSVFELIDKDRLL